MLATLEKWAGPHATGFEHTTWIEGDPVPASADTMAMPPENVRNKFKSAP